MRKGNIFVQINKKGKATILPKTGEFSFWMLDDSELSEVDKAVLEEVKFPKIVKSGACVQKRIAKQKYRKGYGQKQDLKLNDIVYLPFSKKIALQQIAKYTIKEGTAESIEAQKAIIEDMKATKQVEHYYLTGSAMDEELRLILSTFSQPKATPSMAKVAPTVIEVIEEQPAQPSIKALSPTHKGKVKEMCKSMSAIEIANELGVDKKRVIEYLKTLNNG